MKQHLLKASAIFLISGCGLNLQAYQAQPVLLSAELQSELDNVQLMHPKASCFAANILRFLQSAHDADHQSPEQKDMLLKALYNSEKEGGNSEQSHADCEAVRPGLRSLVEDGFESAGLEASFD